MNVAVVGYGLFLALSALPLVPERLFWFTVAQASAFAVAFLARAIGAYRAPERSRKWLLAAAALPYLAGWVCLLAGGLAFAVAGGVLLGIGAAGFYQLWGQAFAACEPERGTRDLLVGTACAPVLYLALSLLPADISRLAAPVAAVAVAGAAFAAMRKIDFTQPMFTDPPADHARVYRHAIADTWRSALCLGGLGLASGVMRAVALGDPTSAPMLNGLSMAALFLVAVMLLLVWSRRSIEFDVPAAYRVTFPFVLAAFLVMAAAPDEWTAPIAGTLFALYAIAVLVMMIQCAQIARDRGVNPLFIVSVYGGIVFALHDLGLVLGIVASGIVVAGLSSKAMLALAAVCLLGVLFAIGQKRESEGTSAEIELVNVPEASPSQSSEPEASPSPAPESTLVDPIASNLDLIRQDYGLTRRETEVADLLARGDTIPRIAERLFISENTVRTHAKHIYQKLGINKKQQLRDLALEYTA